MFNYKKFFKTEKSRFRILRMLNFIPDKEMIRIQYMIKATVRCCLDYDRFNGHKRTIFTKEWKDTKVAGDDAEYKSDVVIQKPENLNEMIKIAEKLSEQFPQVRVDLYSVNNKIYFGEMTFYPWSGYVNFMPDSFDLKLGKCFEIMRY